MAAFIFNTVAVFAQGGSFKMTTSLDTVLLGNYLEVRLKAENVQGRLEEPSFNGFRVISGPSTFSSTTIINGEMSSTSSYTYLIKPTEAGEYILGPVSLKTNDGVLKTEARKIIVVPNPDNIIQNPDAGQEPSFDVLVKPSHQKPAPIKKTYRL
ncbi:MAG: BatD family protein [Saprospiraceae bacterium]